MDAAARSAQAALKNPAWRRITQTDRGKLVRRLAELVLANADELALIECRDNGKLIKEMRAQMRAIPDSYQYLAGMADKLQGDTIPVNKPDRYSTMIYGHSSNRCCRRPSLGAHGVPGARRWTIARY